MKNSLIGVRWIVTLAVVSAGSCSGETTGFDAVESVCERQARCGIPSVMCQGTAPNLTCVGTIVEEDYALCVQSETAWLDGLSPDQRADAEICSQWCVQQECVSQAMVEALAASYEGQDASGFPALDSPPECLAYPEPWFPPCGAYVP